MLESRRGKRVQFRTNQSDPSCGHDVCITCSDSATIARIVEILPGGLARVEAGGSIHEVNVELVDAEPGDTVLVHAGVAIGRT